MTIALMLLFSVLYVHFEGKWWVPMLIYAGVEVALLVHVLSIADSYWSEWALLDKVNSLTLIYSWVMVVFTGVLTIGKYSDNL